MSLFATRNLALPFCFLLAGSADAHDFDVVTVKEGFVIDQDSDFVKILPFMRILDAESADIALVTISEKC